MATIVLIACSSKKKKCINNCSNGNCRCFAAKDLYDSDLFKKSFNFAQSLNPDKIFILSALHHLLDINQKISSYNCTLNDKSKEDRVKWSDIVLSQLKKVADIRNDKFIILAGEKYREFLIDSDNDVNIARINHKNCCIPMKGMKIGQQLHFLG